MRMDVFHVSYSTGNAWRLQCGSGAASVREQCGNDAVHATERRQPVEMTNGWTGRDACALQSALRMSNQDFAAHLRVGVRTVADWHQTPDKRPRPAMQKVLDAALAQASAAVRERFAVLTGRTGDTSTPKDDDSATADAEHRLITDQNISAALNRLDELAGWEPGTARRQVAARLTGLDGRDLLDRANRRRRVGRRSMADALGEYYSGGLAGEHGRYAARCGQNAEAVTSVLTCPDWLDLDCALTADHDRLTLADRIPNGSVALDGSAADAAAQRLAEILAAGTRFADMPLYRLTGINVRHGEIAGSLGIDQFGSYALTLDLLEGELADAVATGITPTPGALPLRDRHLADIPAVLNVADRICAGGALALCAFARPADPYRGPADYLILVQERSGTVVNAARQLAVIPKGFHQPMTDFRNDARIAATLRRETEEELFGRDDIDNTLNHPHAADPMHPTRLSAPMRWLLGEGPGVLRMECTGFGLNLVSGNYEFACLIVVDSDDFWSRFGGEIAASWESSSLRQYSSLDGGSLAALARDEAWSNEGLFAFLQGLRRLKQIGGDRVDMPDIEWMVRP
jgi:DNA-binding transcriptional regulator YiaG